MVTSSGIKANMKIFGLLSVLTGLFIGAGFLLAGRGGMIIGFLLAVVMNMASYWFSDRIVLKMYGASEVSEDENPELHNSLSKLAENAGIPKPRLYRSSMDVPNAFATGRSPSKGVVCVTDGLMRELEHEEVEAVIAHELAHIKNRDTLVNAVVATVAGAIAIIAEIVFWSSLFSGRRDSGEAMAALAFMILTPLISILIRTAISRTMEFRADSNAVRIHGKKQPMQTALEKISAGNRGKPRQHVKKYHETGSNMFIENPFSSDKLTRYFSTHPPLEERLDNIESTQI